MAAPAVSYTPPVTAATSGGGQVITADAWLRKFEEKQLNWTQIKAISVAGAGFLCDAYDLQVISYLTKNIGRQYYPDWKYYSPALCSVTPSDPAGSIPATVCGSKNKNDAFTKLHGPVGSTDYLRYVPSAIPNGPAFAITAVALCGTLTGQILFGVLGDRFGRRSMFMLSLFIIMVFGFLQAFTFGEGQTAVITCLCMFRFFLGIGIGGEYPLSATLVSEYANSSNRGAIIGSVFAMQELGYLLAQIVTLILSAIWQATDANPDYLWRTVLVFSCVPPLLTTWARSQLPETARYKIQEALREQQRQNQLPETWGSKVQRVVDFHKMYGVKLMGVAGSWFFLDVVFYSQNLFQPIIYSSAGWLPAASTMTAADEVQLTARCAIWIALASIIPGYWVTVATVDRIGRWWIQMGGFFVITLTLAIIAGDFNNIVGNVPVFIGLYAVMFFACNWGPNSTTFIVAAEIFPTSVRATGHGLSAAWGKAGSIIGTFGFYYMQADVGLQAALGLLAGISFLGMLTTLLQPETKGISLEELNDEDVHNVKLLDTELNAVVLGGEVKALEPVEVEQSPEDEPLSGGALSDEPFKKSLGAVGY